MESANVTRSTLYRHFGSKDGLIVAYLDAASAMERAAVEEVLAGVGADGGEPARGIEALGSAVVQQIHNPAFRGCAFLNAAAEFPDPAHPIHQAVVRHRSWYAGAVERALGDRARDDAMLFVLLRDGAMSAGCLSDPDVVARAFLHGVEELVAR